MTRFHRMVRSGLRRRANRHVFVIRHARNMGAVDASAARSRGYPPADFPDVTIRPVDGADVAGLQAFYASLSPASRRRRFFGGSFVIGESRSLRFCQPDHRHGEGFVATLRVKADRDGEIIGHLCLERAAEDSAELAIAVADAYQRRGIGRRLFRAAIAWATSQGLCQLVATAFADNAPVIALLSSAPHGATVAPAEGGLVDIAIPLG
jgi:RimJ/RimL family protein N-acetyltransferase